MRRLVMAAIAAAGLIGTLAPPQAQAMPLPSAGVLGVQAKEMVSKVVLVCPRPRWNGFAWVQPPCYQTYYPLVAPAPLYGPPVVVVRRPWRRRVIVY